MSPRLSGDQLAQLSRSLSERDGQVLRLADELRILASRHVEGLVITEGSALTRARRARSVLARLSDLGVLARLERRIGGVRAGSSGHLYRLSHAGQRLLGLPSGRGWREPSWGFIEHTLACGDLHLALAQARTAERIEGFELEHEPMSWRRFVDPAGASQWLKPDLFVQVFTHDFELLWFVEIDRGTESLRRVATKTEQYLAYARTGLEQGHHGVFPRVAWLAPDEVRAQAIARVLEHVGNGALTLCTASTLDGAVGLLAGQGLPSSDGGAS